MYQQPPFQPPPFRPPPFTPDPVRQSYYYEGVTLRRVMGYLIDLVILAILVSVVWLVTGVATLMTLGLLAPVQAAATALTPVVYHTLLVGGRGAATIGMRLMGLKVLSLVESGRPTRLQALLAAVAFYVSVGLTSFLVLAVALFNPRRRTLHDYLSSTVVVRALPDGG